MESKFGKQPRITVNNVDDAAEELLALYAANDRFEEQLNQELAAVRLAHAQRAVVQVNGETVSISERIEILSAAIHKCVDGNQEKLLPSGKKTRLFPAGTISHRDLPGKLELLEGETDKSVLQKVLNTHLESATVFFDAVERLLKRLKLTRVVTLKPMVDVQTIKGDRADKRVTDEQLKSWGMFWLERSSTTVKRTT